MRSLVEKYLVESDENKRGQILAQLKAEEGGQAEYVAKLLAHLKPPLKLPPVNKKDPPGLYRLSVPDGTGAVEYVVQTPPEYDPDRIYPCVLVHGRRYFAGLPSRLVVRNVRAKHEAAFWSSNSLWIHRDFSRLGFGLSNQVRLFRTRAAADTTLPTRCPATLFDRYWPHFRILDITLRFWAAWDLALAHPDLWAGAVLISPSARQVYRALLRTERQNGSHLRSVR